MSTNVDPEEALAIQDAVAPGRARSVVEVVERDFGQPRRYSTSAFEELFRSARANLLGIELFLARSLGKRHALELVAIRETTADKAFGDQENPLALARFLVCGQPGWIVWENKAAVTALDSLLGSKSGPDEVEPRTFSGVESIILGDLFSGFARTLCAGLGVECQDFVVVEKTDEIGTWMDGESSPEPYRLECEFSFEGPGGTSTFRVYLPGPGNLEGGEDAADLITELPEHLTRVEVEVSAQLIGGEVPLAQLLSLEEGDVIPIDARVGESATTFVEGRGFAKAHLGSFRGRRAIRIESFEHEAE